MKRKTNLILLIFVVIMITISACSLNYTNQAKEETTTVSTNAITTTEQTSIKESNTG